MKLTDLHKNQGLKIDGEARRGGVSDRYGKGAAAFPTARSSGSSTPPRASCPSRASCTATS